MKYEVYDLYDGCELLGVAETMNEVNKIINDRVLDTDGECYINIKVIEKLEKRNNMILWSKLDELEQETIEREQILEIQLLVNGHKITSFLEYNEFILTISLDTLELDSTKCIFIDKTIETEQVKSKTRFIQVLLKEEVFE